MADHRLSHPCAICGSPHAPFGVGVSLRKEKPGLWYCRDHRPADPPPLRPPPSPGPPRQGALL